MDFGGGLGGYPKLKFLAPPHPRIQKHALLVDEAQSPTDKVLLRAETALTISKREETQKTEVNS